MRNKYLKIFLSSSLLCSPLFGLDSMSAVKNSTNFTQVSQQSKEFTLYTYTNYNLKELGKLFHGNFKLSTYLTNLRNVNMHRISKDNYKTFPQKPYFFLFTINDQPAVIGEVFRTHFIYRTIDSKLVSEYSSVIGNLGAYIEKKIPNLNNQITYSVLQKSVKKNTQIINKQRLPQKNMNYKSNLKKYVPSNASTRASSPKRYNLPSKSQKNKLTNLEPAKNIKSYSNVKAVFGNIDIKSHKHTPVRLGKKKVIRASKDIKNQVSSKPFDQSLMSMACNKRSINQNKVPVYSKKTKSNRKLMENIEKMEKVVENNLKSMENDSFLDIFSPLNIKDNYPEIKPVQRTLRESIINEPNSYIPELPKYEISSEKNFGQNRDYNTKQTATEDHFKKLDDEFVKMTDKDKLIYDPNENYTEKSIESNEFI